jgi:hypothetical protein
MSANEFSLKSGKQVNVIVTESDAGEIAIAAQVLGETTVTCTCQSTGKSVTKKCPGTNNTCDCSDPNNPKITCG